MRRERDIKYNARKCIKIFISLQNCVKLLIFFEFLFFFKWIVIWKILNFSNFIFKLVLYHKEIQSYMSGKKTSFQSSYRTISCLVLLNFADSLTNTYFVIFLQGRKSIRSNKTEKFWQQETENAFFLKKKKKWNKIFYHVRTERN